MESDHDTIPPSDPLEGLVEECLRRRSLDGVMPVDELCNEHPQYAEALRRRIRRLEELELNDGKPRPPTRIGPYRILQLLGEGGMGTVYLAEQKEPVRRRVAVKVIRADIDSAAVLRRFELERQALALMSHDNIAKVFDAGVTERGLPYFAMEYVPGSPITEFCDQHQLAVEDRLELFAQVCSAVQHAHHKGVIHRDLKPGNVLVVEVDGRPIPKVIDFGLARATDHMLLQQTMFTEQGMLVGTPEYMSPEQADPGYADIDLRTDVYSLGVILHELIVGCLPFAPEELRRAGYLEMRRVLREVDPGRPSATFRRMGAAMVAAADSRATSIRGLRKALEGDLDWVILKALQKDRELRYDTPVELAAEVRRYLAHEPLAAGPPSAAYRLRKLVRRHRVAAAAGALILVTATIGQFVALRQAQEARDRARWDVYTTLRQAAQLLRPPQQDLEDPASDGFRVLGDGVIQADGASGFLKAHGALHLGEPVAGRLMEVLEDVVRASRFECLNDQESTLSEMLRSRFGEIPETFARRVRTHEVTLAHQQDLNRWMLRTVEATKIEAVFESR